MPITLLSTLLIAGETYCNTKPEGIGSDAPPQGLLAIQGGAHYAPEMKEHALYLSLFGFSYV